MTFSRKTEFGYLLPDANKIIERLKNEGFIEKWIKKYLERYESARDRK